MKIAAITEDGITISQHFGRAPYYLVVSIENGQIVERQLRDKLGHQQFAGEHHNSEEHGESHGAGHGMDSASHDKHTRMATAIADCEALLCGGMGMGAYQSMLSLGIRPLVTDIPEIDQAVMAYMEGKITDHKELLH